MQVRNTMRCDSTPIGMAKTKHTDHIKRWEGHRETGNAKRYSRSASSLTRSLKLTMQVPCKPATVLLGTDPGEVKTCWHKNLCRYVYGSFIPYGSFTQSSQKLDTTQMPFREWIHKLCYIHITEYYLARKKEQTADSYNNLDGPAKELCWVKKSQSQNIHAAWFHFHKVLKC